MRLTRLFSSLLLASFAFGTAADAMIFYEKPPREGRFWRNSDWHTSLNMGYRSDRFKSNFIPNGHDLNIRNRANLVATKFRLLLDVMADQMKYMFIDFEFEHGYLANETRKYFGTTATAVGFNTRVKKSGISENLRAGALDWQIKAGYDVIKFFNDESPKFGLKPYVGYVWKKTKWGTMRATGTTTGGVSSLSIPTETESRFNAPVLGILLESKLGNHKLTFNADAMIYGKYSGSMASRATPANPQNSGLIKVNQRRRTTGYQLHGAYDYQFDHNWAARLEANHGIFKTRKKPRRLYERPVLINKADLRTSSVFAGISYIW